METKNNAKKGLTRGQEIGIGVGVAAALAAAAAGAYFLYGKDGAKNRKKIKSWMLKAKGEVLEKMEKLKEVNEEKYNEIVDAVAKKYLAVKEMDAKELALMVKELKSYWKEIHKAVSGKKGSSRKRK